MGCTSEGAAWEYGFKTCLTHKSTTSQSMQVLSWQTYTGLFLYDFNSLVVIFPVPVQLKIMRRGGLCPEL